MVRLMKENKIEHFKDGKYDIKLSPLAMIDMPMTELPKGTNSDDEDADDLLFASAPGRPQ